MASPAKVAPGRTGRLRPTSSAARAQRAQGSQGDGAAPRRVPGWILPFPPPPVEPSAKPQPSPKPKTKSVSAAAAAADDVFKTEAPLVEASQSSKLHEATPPTPTAG